MSEQPAVKPRFGRLGRPLQRNSPYYIGFVGGLGVLAAWYLGDAVQHISDVLVQMTASLFLAVGLNPLVERLIARGFSRRWAVATVGTGVLAIFFGFSAIIAQPLAQQTTELINNLPHNLDTLRHNGTVHRLDDKYHVIQKLKDSLANADTATKVAGGVLGFGKFLLGSVFKAVTMLVLTLYFLGSLPNITDSAYRLVPRSRRERVRLLGDESLRRVGGYVGGALAVACCAGISTWLLLSILDVAYALPLALLVGIADLVPMVGATIGALIATLLVLIDSPGKAVVCAIFFVAYQQLENFLIYPKVMSRTVKVPPAVAVIAALVGGTLFGVMGALLAIPLSAGVLLVIREVFIPAQDRTPADPPGSTVQPGSPAPLR